MKKIFPAIALVLMISQFAFAQEVTDITQPITKIYDLMTIGAPPL